MFSKWIIVLLKYFDFWGHYTEFSVSKGKYHRSVFIIFVLRIFSALSLTLLIAEFLVLPVPLLTTVNCWFQFFCVSMVYWTTIIESYSQRNAQRKFWEILRRISEKYYEHSSLTLASYLSKFLEFSIVFTAAQLILNGYFILTNGSLPCYLFAHSILIRMCQDRMLYYLFYLELLNFELHVIDEGAKQIALITRNNCFSTPEKLNFSFEKIQRNRFKCMRNYYCLISELNTCINSVFGWSYFATVMCCFYIVLTEFNCAYTKFNEMSFIYKQGPLK